MIGSELLRYQKDQRYLIWDIEAESLNLAYSRPWQLSYSLFTLDEILLERSHYIWWDDLHVSAKAAAITHFDYNIYKSKAEDNRKVLDEFFPYLEDNNIIPVGHNILSYDTMINNVWRRELGLKEDYSYVQRSIDTSALFKALKKSFSIDRNNLYPSQIKILRLVEKNLKSKLSLIAKELKIEFDETKLHDSSYDTRLNVEIFRRLLWMIEI